MRLFARGALTFLALLTVGAACAKKTPPPTTTTSGVKLHSAAATAFGSLAGATGTATSTTSGSATANTSTRSAALPAPSAGLKILPVATPYKFVFTGTAPTLTESTVDVFERTVGAALSLPADLQLSAGFGLMNFGSLTNPNLENLSITSGDEQWYIDGHNGTISMYLSDHSALIQPLATKPPSGIAQPSNASTNASATTTNTAADSATALSVAAAFLARHGISTQPYGQPMVTWSYFGYATGVDVKALESTGSVPSSQPIATNAPVNSASSGDSAVTRPIYQNTAAQVVYPLMINGLPAVQQNGDPVGLTLTVDTANKTVTSLYGLNTLDYTSSAYTAVTDFSAVKKIAEQGGIYANYALSTNSTPIKVNLDTPDRVLMNVYLYADNHSRELYVPALRFPLVNPPDTYTKYVVVPLVNDLVMTTPIGVGVPSGSSGGRR